MKDREYQLWSARVTPELKRLTLSQMKNHIERVKFFMRSAEDSAPSGMTGWLMDGLVAECKDRALPVPANRKRYAPQFKLIESILLQNSPPMTAEELFSFGVECASIHLHHLSESGMTLTPELIFGCVNHIPAEFDQGFPGYRMAGLHRLILRESVHKGLQQED